MRARSKHESLDDGTHDDNDATGFTFIVDAVLSQPTMAEYLSS